MSVSNVDIITNSIVKLCTYKIRRLKQLNSASLIMVNRHIKCDGRARNHMLSTFKTNVNLVSK